MPLTLTRYDVIPGTELMFEAGVELARTFLVPTPGYEALTLQRSLNFPGRYWLLVSWRDDASEQTTRDALQTQLNELFSDCLAAAAQMEKCETVVQGSADDETPQHAARNEGLDLYRFVSRPVKPFDTQRRPDAIPGANKARAPAPPEETPKTKKSQSPKRPRASS